MAKEAKVKVQVDVEDARRSMDDVNQRMEKSRSLGAELASSVQGIARGAAAGITAVGAIADRAAGGGLLSTIGGTALDASASGWRMLLKQLGFDSDELSLAAAKGRSFDRAIESTKQLVGAGGDISDQQIRDLIKQFDALYLPGERNRQRAAVIGQDIRGEQVGEAYRQSFASAVRTFEQVVNKLASILGAGP